MKKIILIAAILLGITSSFAQQGSLYIGGVAGFSNQDNNGFKSSSWNFSPEVGTWFSDDLQAGVFVNLQGTNDDNDNKTSRTNPGVYVRKWKSVSDIFSLYAGLNASFITAKTESGGVETKASGFGIFMDAGLALAVADRWGIVGRYAALGYQKVEDVKAFELGVNTLGSPFNIGLYYTFKQ